MGDSSSIVRTWWRDRVDYRWLIDSLESHSALGWMRFMVVTASTVLLLLTVLTGISQAGAVGPIGKTTSVLLALLSGAGIVRWWALPWPRETESLVWLALADVAVTVAGLTVQNRLYGALGNVVLVVTGGYAAIFHGPRILAAHVSWSLLSVLLLSVLMVASAPADGGRGGIDPALGCAVVLIMLVAIAIVLPAAHFCGWLMRRDALTDPLTGLMNRRGLEYYLSRYWTGSCGPIYVMTLDLDRFKVVNDTFGHSFGDEVLACTAGCLRAAARPGSIVARSGGEEFVVAGPLHEKAVGTVAEQLRRAVEAMPGLPITITVSVGVAVFEPARENRQQIRSMNHALLSRSDSAMYQAKQLGGNAVVIADLGAPTADSARRWTDHRRVCDR